MKIINCDHCTKSVEVALMLTSLNPYGVRVICEDCEKLPCFSYSTLYALRTVFAWE